MTLKNKKTFIIIATGITIAGIIIFINSNKTKSGTESVSIIHPTKGTVKLSITTTGIVKPQNRLEIKPPMNGRIDKILIKEGSAVRAGQVLAWMSSEERAALIDAARSKGKAAVRYWENTYKQIPLIAPIKGTIIVKDIEPGQSVTTTTAVLVISDRLIVEADVDETDIGTVKKNQKAIITLDAYPDVISQGEVNHISYESTTVNNVTMYKVDILPDKVPDVYRSGMSANIEIIQAIKENCLLVPYDVIQSDKKGSYIIAVKNEKQSNKPFKKYVKTGITDKNNIEIIEGISENEYIVEKNSASLLQLDNSNEEKSKNPFMPRRPGRKSKKK